MMGSETAFGSGMGWGMGWGMGFGGIFMLLVLVLAGLGVAALFKYLRS